MKKKEYKYSIIMPVYNSKELLDKSISSIMNQTYNNWELIIIDDGSTDDSWNKINEYSNIDDRIKCFRKENGGPGIARNFGIQKVTGEYVAFLDADDYYETCFLENVNEENQKKDYDLLFISVTNENKQGKIKYYDNLEKYSTYDKTKLIGMQIAGILPWGPFFKVVKSNIVRQCEFSALDVGEEAVFSYNLLNLVQNYTFVKKTLYHYVHTENGQHKKGGYEPWRPVINNIKNIIIENNSYEKYEEYINCLALKSLSIFIYRCSSNNSIFKAIEMIKQKEKEYRREYSLEKIDNNILEKSTKCIIKLLKWKMYFTLVVISKLRNKLNKMED